MENTIKTIKIDPEWKVTGKMVKELSDAIDKRILKRIEKLWKKRR